MSDEEIAAMNRALTPAERLREERRIVEQSWDTRWDERDRRGWKKKKLNKWIMGSIEAQAQRGELPERAQLLDLGCGTGRYLIPLTQKGYRVTGVDISGKALQELRARLPHGQRVRLIQRETRKLVGIDDESMDMALGAGVIHHNRWEGIAKSFAEVARVLKSGKHFLFADRFIDDATAPRNAVPDRGYAAMDIAGGKEEVVQHYFTIDELVQLADDHGLEIFAGPIVYAGARDHDPDSKTRVRCFIDYRKR